MSDDPWTALCDFVKHPQCYADPREPWEVITTPRKTRLTRKRRVTVARAMKQAAKAGVSVRDVIVKSDGSVALQLGEPVSANVEADITNEWDEVMQ
jgi:hypothetical protein